MAEDRMQAHGNADVVAALEHFLVEARKGRIAYTAIMCLHADPKIKNQAYFGGSIEQLPRAHKDLGTLRDMMKSKMLDCELPPRDDTLDASYACYNCCTAPLSFDFLAWLVDAEMTRVRCGAPLPLKVHFWFGHKGEHDPRITQDKEMGLGLPSRKIMLENVCRPMLKLIGAVEDPKVIGGWFTAVCTTRGIVEAAKAGEPVPKFKSPLPSPIFGQYVTITLREAVDWPHRNSNIDAWMKFAFYLRGEGERVIFVRETGKADVTLDAFGTSPKASKDLLYRMALYNGAKANLFVSNGPASLAWFSDKPWLMFTEVEQEGLETTYKPNTPKAWRENMGIDVGQQWPWSKPNQRIIWQKDDYENIVQAWCNFIA